MIETSSSRNFDEFEDDILLTESSQSFSKLFLSPPSILRRGIDIYPLRLCSPALLRGILLKPLEKLWCIIAKIIIRGQTGRLCSPTRVLVSLPCVQHSSLQRSSSLKFPARPMPQFATICHNLPFGRVNLATLYHRATSESDFTLST